MILNNWEMPKIILAKVLKRKKISKRQLAKLLNYDYPGIFHYFRPRFNPRFSTLVRLSKALKCKVTDLIED